MIRPEQPKRTKGFPKKKSFVKQKSKMVNLGKKDLLIFLLVVLYVILYFWK